MTAPRPEAVEKITQALQRAYCQNNGLGYYERWTALIDAALTAARADEREKCAQIVDQWETAQDAIVTDLNRKLQCTSPHDYAAQCLEGCAAAIRAMEGR